jgi:hypothetical protein
MKLAALPTIIRTQSTAPHNQTDSLLQKFNLDDKIKPTPQMLNPLDYQQYDTNLSIKEIVKKSQINPSIAKKLTLEDITQSFPNQSG